MFQCQRQRQYLFIVYRLPISLNYPHMLLRRMRACILSSFTSQRMNRNMATLIATMRHNLIFFLTFIIKKITRSCAEEEPWLQIPGRRRPFCEHLKQRWRSRQRNIPCPHKWWAPGGSLRTTCDQMYEEAPQHPCQASRCLNELNSFLSFKLPIKKPI